MGNFTSTSTPVRNRFGKIIGTDTILTPVSPVTPPTIRNGCVRVACSCGRIHDNIPQTQWDKWPDAPRELNGVCGCVAHFV